HEEAAERKQRLALRRFRRWSGASREEQVDLDRPSVGDREHHERVRLLDAVIGEGDIDGPADRDRVARERRLERKLDRLRLAMEREIAGRGHGDDLAVGWNRAVCDWAAELE